MKSFKTLKIAAMVLVFGFTFMSISAQAQATPWTSVHGYYTYLHFDGIAFSKPVSAVFAHIGIERLGGFYGSSWLDVKHVQMSKMGHSPEAPFNLRLYLQGVDGKMEGNVTGVIVQYWVYFTDGTRMITNSTLVPVLRSESCNSSRLTTPGSNWLFICNPQMHEKFVRQLSYGEILTNSSYTEHIYSTYSN